MPEFGKLIKRHAAANKLSDQRAALICSVVANCHRDKKQKAFKVSDFMPKEKKKQTNEQMLGIVKAIHAAYKGVKP